jgi:hypothetical protein
VPWRAPDRESMDSVQPGDRCPWPPETFFRGTNLPWIDYGCDFGSSAWLPDGGLGARPGALADFEGRLARLAPAGSTLVRLFLWCDLRSGIRFDAAGIPLGVDDAFFRDADAALDAAATRGVRLMPVLFDFLLCARPRLVNGVQLGGRGAVIFDPHARDRLLSLVVRPALERYADHPAVMAWDLFNEPEWCARRRASTWYSRRIGAARIRGFLRELTACARASARQPVTVGSAGTSRLDLVRGIGLDFYQVHWYERFGWPSLARPVAHLRLDRPVVLGEFPGAGAEQSREAIISAARSAGYAGAIDWPLVSCEE